MHFFDWAKKCQETHQHCMLDRTLFLLAQKKLSKKMLYHMVASRCGIYFIVLDKSSKEIEQLANQQANIATFSE